MTAKSEVREDNPAVTRGFFECTKNTPLALSFQDILAIHIVYCGYNLKS